jgi:hypothetical protein
VAGAGRLPHLMEGESARAVEEGQPSQTRAASKAKWLMVASTASPPTMCPSCGRANSVPAWTLSGRLHAPSCSRPDAPDFERGDRIGEFWGYPESRTFVELLIDCEEDRVLRAVLVGMLREVDRQPRP